METVSMARAEVILEEFFGEHAGHDVTPLTEPGKVELWCEDCKELRGFRIEGFRQAVGDALKRDGALTF